MHHLPTAKKVSNWLSSSFEILALYQQKSQQLIQLNGLWCDTVGSVLGEVSRVANLEDNILVIEVDNASWASRLRYEVPKLLPRLKHCSPDLAKLINIKWYINRTPPLKQSSSFEPKVNFISNQNRILLNTVADSIENEKLKQALRNLACHSDI